MPGSHLWTKDLHADSNLLQVHVSSRRQPPVCEVSAVHGIPHAHQSSTTPSGGTRCAQSRCRFGSVWFVRGTGGMATFWCCWQCAFSNQLDRIALQVRCWPQPFLWNTATSNYSVALQNCHTMVFDGSNYYALCKKTLRFKTVYRIHMTVGDSDGPTNPQEGNESEKLGAPQLF